jgi:hypothetical protein
VQDGQSCALLIGPGTHRPIDLLDDRVAEVFANWVGSYVGVEIIRARAGAFEERSTGSALGTNGHAR